MSVLIKFLKLHTLLGPTDLIGPPGLHITIPKITFPPYSYF